MKPMPYVCGFAFLMLHGVCLDIPFCAAQSPKESVPFLFRVKATTNLASVTSGEPLKVVFSFEPTMDQAVYSVANATGYCTFDIFQNNKLVSPWKQPVCVAMLSAAKMPGAYPRERQTVTTPPQVTELPVGEYTLRLRTLIRYRHRDDPINRRGSSILLTPVLEDTIFVPFSVKAKQ